MSEGQEDIERVLSTPVLSVQVALPSVPSSSSIVIRAFRHSDAASLAVAADHFIIWQNMTNAFPHPYILEDAKIWINLQHDVEKTWKSTVAAESGQHKASRVPQDYAITLNDNPIGAIGLKFQTDIECRSAELGYWLSPAYWKSGIMSTLTPAFLEWTFNTFPYLVRVSAKIFSWNKSSMRVCEKAGMVRESVMKKAVWKDGRLGDLVVYVILRKENSEKYEAFEG